MSEVLTGNPAASRNAHSRCRVTGPGDAVDQQFPDAEAGEQLVELGLLGLDLAATKPRCARYGSTLDVVETVVDAHVEELARLERLGVQIVLRD